MGLVELSTWYVSRIKWASASLPPAERPINVKGDDDDGGDGDDNKT